MSKLKEIIHQYVVEALEEILSEEAEQISEMNFQDDKWKLVKTYPAQSEKHATAKVYKNITGKHYRNNEDYHIRASENGKVTGEGFADDEEDAHMQAKHISGHPVKKEVEEGYKREMRLVGALKKNPSNEKLKSQTNSAFNRGIERSLRSIRKRNSERVQKASQSDPHDQNF